MEFYERRPKFSAAQFDGTSMSIEKINRMLWNKARGYTLTSEGGKRTLVLNIKEGSELTFNDHDWVVRHDDQLFVLTDDEFQSRFEQVAP